jgi:photosystem II stability/assembly factor-like uncharacterized protein
MNTKIKGAWLALPLTVIGVLWACGSGAAAPDNYAGWTVGAAQNGYGTILRSIDSGNSWTRQGAGQIAAVDLTGVVAVDPYTAWVVGDSDGYAAIYHTADGGSTWIRKGSPAEIPDIDLNKVHASDDNNVWAVGDSLTESVILHSSDGGDTWTNRIPAGYELAPLQGVSSPNRDTVWVTGGPLDGYPLILKSADAGLSWTRQSGGDVARPGYDHILGISAVDGETAWAIGGISGSQGWFVLKTTDGGDTWTMQTEGAHDGNEICAVDASTVWAASDSVISWSADGGATWGSHNSYEYTMGISAIDSREAWAVSCTWKGSIWHTTDGGLNWTVIEELGGETLPGLWTISFSSQPIPAYLVLESGDYDGDGRSNIAIFRPLNGLWAVQGLGRIYFGTSADIPASGDYNGDGTTDVAVFRPANAMWALKNITRLYFGSSGDIPIPGDYNGDDSCDVAVYRGAAGLWAIRNLTSVYFGATGDQPVPADYNLDGFSDISVFRPSSVLWAIKNLTRAYFGSVLDVPVPAEFRWYNGADIAVYRYTTGLWAVRNSTRFYFGSSTDMPITGDFGGSSLDDTAIFRATNGLWAIRGITRAYFGATGDIPVTR